MASAGTLSLNMIMRTQAFERDMRRTRKHVSSFDRKLKTFSRTLMSLAAAGGGIYALKRGFTAITQAYMVQEKAERDLMAAIRLTDAEYKTEVKTLKRVAAEFQKQTIYGDEAILSQMAYAKNLGVTTDQLEAAAKAAIGLAAKYRIDLASAMMLVGRASQGQTQMLTRYGIVLDQNLSDQEKFNELLKIGAGAFQLAREETQTLSGKLQQQANRWGDIKERIAGDSGVVGAYSDLLDQIEKNESTISKWVADFTQGLAEIVSGFESVRDINRLLSQEMAQKQTGQMSLQDRYNLMIAGVPPIPMRMPDQGAFGGGGGGQFGRYGAQGGWTVGRDLTPWEQMTAIKPPAATGDQAQGFVYAPGTPMGKMEISASGQYRLDQMKARRELMNYAGALPGTEYGTPNSYGSTYSQMNMSQTELPAQYKSRYDVALAARQKYDQKTISSARKRMLALTEQVDREISLLGKLNEPRQHARMMVEYQAEAAKVYGANTEKAITATERFSEQLDKLALAEKFNELAQSMEYSITGAFDRMAFEGAKFGDAMKTVAQEVLREFMRIMVFRPAAQAISGGMSDLLSGVFSAKGNAFSAGRVVPMARGGIVDRPAVFPMAHGMGLMGEAGPEAVMPLRRGPGGKLGVEASATPIKIDINNKAPVNVRQAGPPAFNGREWVVSLIMEDYTSGGPTNDLINGRMG